MTMAELKTELTNIADRFMNVATKQRDKDQRISYLAFHVSEICRKAAENMKQDPVEAELEGGGHTWWYVCPECHGEIDDRDHYCRHCGQEMKR